ncbi:hypothetical protein [Aquimarina agarilytica]|uniref:hypothetical protein n=1 Tax=Aquimarina agarilytica TaxID=1087449 RepID=UPI0002881796|nr:hypothetical protein [Aquimarina agarilytica]
MQYNFRTYIQKKIVLKVLYCVLFFGFSVMNAQNQFQVRNAIDSTSIKIGSIVNYAIQVEGNKGKNVVFPEGDSFNPLEVLESFKIDTLDEGGKYRLLKQYALTQFDSGHYYIPRQKVIIGDKTFYTDSLALEVRDVVVDTSKTKLYDVKGIMAVEDHSETDWMQIVYWIIGGLLVIGLVMFLVWRFGQKKVDPESLLPIYDKTLLALERVPVESLLSENKYKEYYSQLTDIAKKYLEEELTEHALESTTDELITALNLKVKMGDVSLNKEAIAEFKNTLQNADYAKFAAMNPSLETAQFDKQIITSFIQKVNEGKPELTEEQLLLNETYRLEQEAKRKRKRQNSMIIAGVVALIAAILTFFAVQNFNKITGLVLGKAGNALLDQEWITSTYGVPGVSISTPEILTRNPVKIEGQQQQVLSGNQVYLYGELKNKFNIIVNTLSFRQDIGYTVEQGVESVFKQIEQQGGTNILVKDEDFETLSGTAGKKVFGSFEYPIPETEKTINFEYTILIFAEGQGAQQVFVFYEKGDKASEKVKERIINSVEINKSDN